MIQYVHNALLGMMVLSASYAGVVFLTGGSIYAAMDGIAAGVIFLLASLPFSDGAQGRRGRYP